MSAIFRALGDPGKRAHRTGKHSIDRSRRELPSSTKHKLSIYFSLLILAVLLMPVSPAHAGVGFGVVPDFPTTVTVGQTGVPGTYTITNVSDGSQAVGNVTITTMTLVPSCSNFSTSCLSGTADPNTFTLSATGTGQAGTACAGTTFTIVVINPATGEVEFQPVGGPVVLGPPSLANDLDTCRINFTFSVNKVPNHDSFPSAGIQTNQLGFASGIHDDATIGTGSGSDVTTVAQAQPTITTTATPPAALGGTSTDSATLSAPAGLTVPPAAPPTGTITFQLFAPNNATCDPAGAVFFTSTVAVDHFGPPPYSSGASGPITAPGTYHWTATYSGDANYLAAGPTACLDPAESFTLAQAQPTITTTATPPATLGGTSTDSATLTAPAGVTVPPAPAPTGTITFQLFAPNNPTCDPAGSIHSTATVPVDHFGAPPYSSGASAPITMPGTYHWTATYSGDANYAAAGPTACLDPAETFTVATAAPSLTTTATGPANLGGTSTDSATLTAPAGVTVPPAPAPTGTITFRLFAPNNPTCDPAGAVHSTNTATVDHFGPPPYSSGASAPITTPGTYHWTATYSGDANYAAAGPTACLDPAESFSVGTAAPSLTTTASAPATLGGTSTDSATLAAPAGVTVPPAPAPTGTITFQLFAPNNPTCDPAGAIHSTNTATVDHFGPPPYSSGASAPITTPGTYHWVASYSGDSNYSLAGPTACADPAETFTLSAAQPAIVTQVSPTTANINQPITDTATLSGGVNPTGTITFTLFGPDNATCTGTPIFTDTATVAGNGNYTSDPFTPTAPGTYRWVVSYSGDAGNSAVSSPCNAPNEQTVVRALPSIQVIKTVDPASREVPGGDFTFTVVVTNTSSVPLVITSLTDDVYGNLATRPEPNTCDEIIGDTLQPGQSTTPCTFVGPFTGDAGDSQTDVVTVVGVDSSGNQVTDNDDAVVTLFGPTAQPAIRVEKDASPPSRPQPGGTFVFTVRVSNIGPIALTIESLIDDVHGNLNDLPAPDGGRRCSTLIGTVLQPGETSPACQFIASFTGNAGASQTDVVTVTGRDSQGRRVTDTDEAIVRITGVDTITQFFFVQTPPPPPPAPLIVTNNNSSNSTSSSTASAAGPAVPVPVPVVPIPKTPLRTLVRTGFDSLGLAAFAALLINVGFLMLERSRISTEVASPSGSRRRRRSGGSYGRRR